MNVKVPQHTPYEKLTEGYMDIMRAQLGCIGGSVSTEWKWLDNKNKLQDPTF